MLVTLGVPPVRNLPVMVAAWSVLVFVQTSGEVSPSSKCSSVMRAGTRSTFTVMMPCTRILAEFRLISLTRFLIPSAKAYFFFSNYKCASLLTGLYRAQGEEDVKLPQKFGRVKPNCTVVKDWGGCPFPQ